MKVPGKQYNKIIVGQGDDECASTGEDNDEVEAQIGHSNDDSDSSPSWREADKGQGFVVVDGLAEDDEDENSLCDAESHRKAVLLWWLRHLKVIGYLICLTVSAVVSCKIWKNLHSVKEAPTRAVVPLTSAPLETLPWKFIDDQEEPYFLGYLEFCGSSASGVYGYQVPVENDAHGSLNNDGNASECGPGSSPVIRIHPLNSYRLVLINKSDQPTNLHMHGLHAPGQGGESDDIVRMVSPGRCLSFSFKIRSSHDVGTFWYHAHLNPETDHQVGGGAYGMLIVDYENSHHLHENYKNQTIPPHLEAFLLDREREIPLQFFTKYDKYVDQRSTQVNGLENVSLNLFANEYYYMRISAVSMSDKQTYVIFDPPDACEARVVAYDGIYRSKVPHERPSHIHFVSVASRLDLAVTCSKNAIILYRNESNYGNAGPGAQNPVSPLVKIHVKQENIFSTNKASTASPFWDPTFETQWSPIRPYYLAFNDSRVLSSGGPENTSEPTHGAPWIVDLKTHEASGDIPKFRTISGATWDAKKPVRAFRYGQVVHWTLKGSHKHPFHAHVDAMQIVQPGGCGRRYEEWEFYDTISASYLWERYDDEDDASGIKLSNNDTDDECNVRLFFADFAGRVVLHCHRLHHEDIGMMTWVDIEDGPGHGEQNLGDTTCVF